METHREGGGRAVEATVEGLLYVEVECLPELETEFHAWYNLEHVPERLRIPGFRNACRYAAVEGRPRWLATYGLDNPAVLGSRVYRQWMGPLQTPWTARMVSSTRVRRSVFRSAGRVGKGDASDARGLLAIRYASAAPESQRLHNWHDLVFARDLTGGTGVVRADRYEDVETAEHLVLYHLDDAWVTQQQWFAKVWVAGWEGQRDSLADWKRTLYVRIL